MNTFNAALEKTKADAMFDAVWKNSPHFRIEMEWEEARQFIRRIEAYNNFEWQKVHIALDLIDHIIPRMEYGMIGGKPNPNNGRRNYRLEIGRERSPVMYIDRYEFNDISQQPPLTEDMCKEICKIMEDIGADEADYTIEEETNMNHSRHIELRFWFD